MIIGNGLIGKAMRNLRGPGRNAIIYAAGVSSSICNDQWEFDRERARLSDALLQPGRFVYFSSCGVAANKSPYLSHKLAMEELVKARGDFLICRLPILAGHTTNPYTLLNFLFDKISRSVRFNLQMRSRRHVVDIFDVVDVTEWLLRNDAVNEIVDIAPPSSNTVVEIVEQFERIVGKKAICNRVDEGDWHEIDTRRIEDAPVDFSGNYLERTLARHYAR